VSEKVSQRVCCWGQGNRTGAPRRGKWGRGEKLENNRKKEANHKEGSFKAKERGGCEEAKASLARGSQRGPKAAA